jgi:hypothetical protein
MADQADPPAAASPDPRLLAESLRAVAEAFDHARASGLSVAVPESLYEACLDIVDRHDAPGGKPPGARRSIRKRGPSAASGISGGRTGDLVKLKDVPLRRLVWQVINPDEEFTVTDIGARLTELGAVWPATAVSNVLGYWVSRERLTRVRKGTYSYSRPSTPSGSLPSDDRQEGPDDNKSRVGGTRRREQGTVTISHSRRKAAS